MCNENILQAAGEKKFSIYVNWTLYQCVGTTEKEKLIILLYK